MLIVIMMNVIMLSVLAPMKLVLSLTKTFEIFLNIFWVTSITTSTNYQRMF